MPLIGDDDALELQYMARLKALLTRHGLPVDYGMDRAAIDTGLHLFLTGGPAREVGQTPGLVPRQE